MIFGKEGKSVEKNDLTQGSIGGLLLRFALPFLIANLLQSLYGAVDLLVVGKYCTAASVAAVSTGTQVTQIVTSLITGLTVGSTVLIGSYVGAKDLKTTREIMGTSLCAFLSFGLILTVLMLVLAKPILGLLNTPEQSFSLTLSYVSVCALGNVFICGYNAISAVLRGYGDSHRPMLFVGLACLLNILLDVVFVKYLGMDVAGTALATVISQAVSMVTAIAYLRHKEFLFDFKLRSFRPRGWILRRLLAVGVPVSFQELLIRISFLYIAFAMNSCGLYAAAVVGIGAKYDVFAMLTSNSMASALTAITAQNMGAGKPRRARQALFACMGISFLVSSCFWLWAQQGTESMISVFSQDPDILQAGIPYFKTASYDYLATALVFCLNGYLNGRQKTLWTMLSSSFSAVALRIPLTYVTVHHFGDSLGAIGTVAPLVTAITAAYTLLYVLKKE